MNAKINVGAKHLLAKLMAEENITVIHRQGAQTAMFDGTKRVLVLPIWKDMQGFTYSHLIGHEVGHALFSIPVLSQGMDDAIDYIDPDNRNLVKNFLNVCEDARIEKLMIQKYPGLAMDFRQSYKKMMDENMFGTNGRDINEYPLADRINIQAKLGSLIEVNFTEEEKEIYDEVMNAITWDQTVVATKKLYDYCSDLMNQQNDNSGEGDSEDSSSGKNNKKNQKKNKNRNKDQEDYEDSGTLPEKNKEKNKDKKKDKGDDKESGDDSEDGQDGEADETDGDGEGDGDGSGEGNESEDGDSEGQDGESDGSDGDDSGDGEDGDEDSEGFSETEKPGKKSSKMPTKPFGQKRIPPTCDTQATFDSKSQNLVDKNAKNIEYFTIPKAILPNLIIPYKKVIKNITNFYTTNYPKQGQEGRDEFEKFRLESKSYIDYMVQEFNLKKAADESQRATIAKTGMIDVGQLHSYKYNDDVFRRTTILPGEKNHALVIFVDFSGSMTEHMIGTIEQALNTAMYCRRLNIPFEMYSFGAAGERSNYGDRVKCWEASGDDFEVHNTFRLRQYFGIGMSQNEFHEACVGLYTMGVQYKNARTSYSTGYVPPEESLGGTPLNETILAAFSIVENIQKKTKAEITTVAVITDGEGGYYNNRVNPVKGYYTNNDDILRDPVTKMEWRMNYNNQTAVLVEALRHRLNVNAVGFYICSGNASTVKHTAVSMLQRYNPNSKVTEDMVRAKFENDHFYGIEDVGYETYFIIAGGKDISTSNANNTVSGDMNADFINKAKFKKKKRIVLGRFVELMAKKTILGKK